MILMKLLSVDIGIKNLAHCLFEVQDSVRILDWDVLDVTDLCHCGKRAIGKLHQEYYCKLHFPTKSSDVRDYCEKRSIVGTLSEMKAVLKREFVQVESSLIQYGKGVIQKYASLDPDIVIVENQIGPLASTMKAMQGIVIQYWLMRGVKVEIISSSNKLKLFHSEKTTYSQRKKLSIEYTLKLLALNSIEATFSGHTKKDDLADTFLQGVWYLQKVNCGLLKINCS